ncbi:alpha/beta hydrolase [Panacibacter ginsenosidivorans]|uniref:Alpha/beta hydrolase n=1 Tax=Panacibacter ginsenosidivorans TaxID=1813871 RepID=A0A5B8V2R2_9BACT|nr:dienelactone hydrolase family protein [Panacibacter ginsenosidivorans]QEC65797.1 alpha/beta hydrolase [Panacibacter ginsenosidivorans]
MDLQYNGEVHIPVDKTTVEGELIIPHNAGAVVIFSHGSGSSRFSVRNQIVAKFLQQKNFGTLLLDLLTKEEDRVYNNRFNIDLLTKRLAGATEWLERFPSAKECRIGYFGASTGAASALRAATMLPQIQAVVSRGGRPDLAMNDLKKVQSPTLLIVGSLDIDVLQLNKHAYLQLTCEKKLEVVDGATHLFEEPGKMDIVSGLAAKWFEKYLHSATQET